MTYIERLANARKDAEAIDARLHGLKLRGDVRSRVALACFAVAQQHHSAILVLLSHFNPLPSSAFALLRPLLEATLRGHWAAKCANDSQVENIITGSQHQFDMASVIDALNKKSGTADKHQGFYKKVWPELSAFVHTFEIQLQAWVATSDVESSYTEEQLVQLIDRAANTMVFAELGIRSLTQDGAPNA
jgi:hypothetical protein